MDLTYLNDQMRYEWIRERDLDTTTWWANAYADDFSTGAGDFAETFAYWAVGDPSTSRIGSPIDAADLTLLESFLPTAAA